jgi:hypothetical protein
MIGLLVNVPQADYPADYLLGRLPARQARWEEMLAPAGWTALGEEFRWLYGQLHHRLRQELAPLFLYFELRPLFLFLRGLAGKKGEGGKMVLMATLLADDLKRELLREQEVGAALRRLSRSWPAGIDLGRLYGAGGLTAVEQGMTRQVLETAARRPTALQPFWAALVDLENIMALAKRLRWQARRPFSYRMGGAIDLRRLIKVEQGKTSVMSVAGGLAQAVQQRVWPLEDELIDRVRRQVARQERPLAPDAAVAAYMWGAYGTMRRLAMAATGEIPA